MSPMVARAIPTGVIGMAVILVVGITIHSIMMMRTGFRTASDGADAMLVIICPWATGNIAVIDVVMLVIVCPWATGNIAVIDVVMLMIICPGATGNIAIIDWLNILSGNGFLGNAFYLGRSGCLGSRFFRRSHGFLRKGFSLVSHSA